MNLTVKIKLLTDEEQYNRLFATMRIFNHACNYISEVAYSTKTFAKFEVHKACYYNVRETYGLSSQMAVRAIGKVCESYKEKAKRVSLHTFKDTGAMVLDDRLVSFKGLEAASVLTLDGRIEVPMMVAEYHRGMLMGRRVRGQADLILDDGVFYLLLVIELPDKPIFDAEKFLGVDLGIVNIAADSTGETFSGAKVTTTRKRNTKLRAKLQSKGTKSAKRLLKERSKRERRFAADVNHCISKRIVEKAKALGAGIALEDLGGIRRNEKTVAKAQRQQLSSWSFHQLRLFIEYKAQLSGVRVAIVDARNTSRQCPKCGYTDEANRPTRDDFECMECGYADPADYVAAVNISRRAAVNQPNVGA